MYGCVLKNSCCVFLLHDDDYYYFSFLFSSLFFFFFFFVFINLPGFPTAAAGRQGLPHTPSERKNYKGKEQERLCKNRALIIGPP